MIQTNTIKIKNQPNIWAKNILNTDPKKNIIYKLIRKQQIKFKYRNFDSALFDYLIMGSNPILTLLELSTIKENKPTNVGIILSDNNDFWGYHIFKLKSFYEELSLKVNKKISNINDFFDFIQINNNLNIYIINESWMTISDVFFSQAAQGFYLFGKEESVKFKNKSEILFPTLNKLETDIKNEFISLFYKKISKSHQLKIDIPKIIVCDRKYPFCIFMTKNLIITSETQNILTQHVDKHEDFMTFSYQNDIKSAGSAKKISHSIDGMEKHTINEIYQYFIC